MNANVDIITRVRKAATEERHEQPDLHPARGILLAVGVSLLGWALALAVFFAA
jgi:hypothetical protein